MERSIPKCNKRRTGLGDKRVRQNRAKLREAFLELLAQHPFEEITVRQISDLSGVGYTTFFRHFPSKEGLLDVVITEEITRLTELGLPIYDNNDGPGACLALCMYVDKHRPLWSALLMGGAAPKVRDEMLKQSHNVTLTREEHSSLPPNLSAALAVAVSLELLSWWLIQPNPWPTERIAKILHDYMILPGTM